MASRIFQIYREAAAEIIVVSATAGVADVGNRRQADGSASSVRLARHDSRGEPPDMRHRQRCRTPAFRPACRGERGITAAAPASRNSCPNAAVSPLHRCLYRQGANSAIAASRQAYHSSYHRRLDMKSPSHHEGKAARDKQQHRR